MNSKDTLLDFSGKLTGSANVKSLGISLAVSLAIYFVISLIDPIASYGPLASKALGFFIAVVFFMITGGVPLAPIAILVATLGTMIGFWEWGTVGEKLGSSQLYNMMGMLIVASGCEFTPFGRRVGYLILKQFGQKPVRMLLFIGISAAALSSVISNVAIIILYSSIINSLLLAMDQKPGESHFGKAIMCVIPMCACVGGMALFCGSPTGNAAALSFMTNAIGDETLGATFTQWASISVPTFIVGIVPCLLIYVAYFRVNNESCKCLPEEHYVMLLKELGRPAIADTVRPGMNIAITAGSRSPANIVEVTRAVVDFIKSKGANPFIIPAMGSHGGATAEGQREMVESIGITEEAMGCPIRSSMEVVHLTDLEDGRPVYIDKNAYEADGIVIINRIKSHTSFTAPHESGLVKMCAIGLGKQYGAAVIHAKGLEGLGPEVQVFGKTILMTAKILFGIGLVENAYHQTNAIRALLPAEILTEEPKLLQRAKALSASILFEHLDVLIVDQLGKNIAGPGFDPHVLHQFFYGHPANNEGRRAQRIVALDLTDESHGTALGGGVVDFLTKRFVDKFDRNATYANIITNKQVEHARISPYFDSDKLAIQAAITTLKRGDPDNLRIARIKNTLTLGKIQISPALLEEAKHMDNIRVLTEPRELPFDENGNLF